MAVKRGRGGLGKGLDSLIPPSPGGSAARQNSAASENKTQPEVQIVEKVVEKVVEKPAELKIRLSQIEPNRDQPRKVFDEDGLIELADSIKQYGVLQPLLVQKKEDYYEIIAGERRWRAAKLAGLKEVPVIVRDYTDQETVEISLIENIQRESLNPIEEAQAYRRLMDEFHLRQDEIAERVSKSRTAVTNSMRLLKLEERVQQMVIDEMLTTGHVRPLLGIEDGDLQYATAMKIFDEKLSVRETERLVKSLTEPKEKKKEKKHVSAAEAAAYEHLEEKIKEILGTRVKIQRGSRHKGRIEIEYYSEEELERIVDLFESIR